MKLQLLSNCYDYNFNFNSLTPLSNYSEAQILLKKYIKLPKYYPPLIVYTKDRNSLKLIGQCKNEYEITKYNIINLVIY